MLRYWLKNFQRVLILEPSNVKAPLGGLLHRTVFQGYTAQSTNAVDAAPAEAVKAIEDVETTEPDGDYIVSYRSEGELTRKNNQIVEIFRTRFRLSPADVDHIMSSDLVHRAYRERPLIHTLDALCHLGVTKRNFVEYPWLITLDKTNLNTKIALINLMPVRDINHFVPFLRLTVPRLRKLVTSLNREAKDIPFGNRVYYISHKLQLDPATVTKYLSKRLFVLEMPFLYMDQNLQHMINYNVIPIDILKDLWAFRYTPKSVKTRLERASTAKKEKIMPWMVRCPEPILQKSLKITTDELAVLGDKTSVVEYVAERLQFDIDVTRAIMAKHELVNRVRVTKIKEVLDFLLNEAGFDRFEIARVPRILCHSLETTKQRLDELKSYGCRPSSLIILCRSKREYEKFVNAWLSKQKKDHQVTSERKEEEPTPEQPTKT